MVYQGALQPENPANALFCFAEIPYCTNTPTALPHLSIPFRFVLFLRMRGRCCLTDNQLAVVGEVVRRDLEVERGGSFPDAARDVVVGAVAGAEPSAVVAGLADGHATQVCADAWSGPLVILPSSPIACQPAASEDIPNMTSHSGFLTRWSSVSGSLNEATLMLLASSISAEVRWRMKTGLPRHLMMTCIHVVSHLQHSISWQKINLRSCPPE